MKLIVFGANGGVGGALVKQAISRGHEVTAAIRSPTDQYTPGARFIACDVLDAGAVRSAVQGHDAVLCAVGAKARGTITLYSTAARNIVAAMHGAGIGQLVFLSNFGVSHEKAEGMRQSALLWLINRVLRHTLIDHRAALEILGTSELDWTAVRAMPLDDGPLTACYRVTHNDLPPHGLHIARADVAHFMLEAIARRNSRSPHPPSPINDRSRVTAFGRISFALQPTAA